MIGRWANEYVAGQYRCAAAARLTWEICAQSQADIKVVPSPLPVLACSFAVQL